MRPLLTLMLACLPLLKAQDSAILKSVEPDYTRYSPDLVTDFETAVARVTLTVQADGKPFAFNSVPLPMAVVMALKDYEFRPEGTVPHGRVEMSAYTHQVTLDVPIRQSRDPGLTSEDPDAPWNPVRATVYAVNKGQATLRWVEAFRLNSGIAAAKVTRTIRPEYPAAARQARIQGKVTFDAWIGKEGDVKSLRASNGPFVLLEAAYEAVKQWMYSPTRLNQVPVDVVTEIPVNFTLD